VAFLCVLSLLGALVTEAYACPVCFGNASGPMTDGVNMAILALLGITAAVLGGFVAFFFHLMKRSRLAFGETVRSPGQVEERF
jgi:polyferredoxin